MLYLLGVDKQTPVKTVPPLSVRCWRQQLVSKNGPKSTEIIANNRTMHTQVKDILPCLFSV